MGDQKNPAAMSSCPDRSSPDTHHVTVQVAAGIVMRAGRMLITRRKPGTHLGGLWEFPGGKREQDETLEDCLRRELHEELGIAISDLSPYQVVRHRYPEREVELHFFRCALAEGVPRNIGCEEFRWVTSGELAGYDFPTADRSIIQILLDGDGR